MNFENLSTQESEKSPMRRLQRCRELPVLICKGFCDTTQDTGVLHGIDTGQYMYSMFPTLVYVQKPRELSVPLPWIYWKVGNSGK